MRTKFSINDFNTWDVSRNGFFLSKSDESGTVYIGIDQLEDVKELIKRTEDQLKMFANCVDYTDKDCEGGVQWRNICAEMKKSR